MLVSDEPTLADHLGHSPYVQLIGEQLVTVQPPYVLGVCGGWGSGKTSFLRKLYAYLSGTTDAAKIGCLGKVSPEFAAAIQTRKATSQLNKPGGLHLVWFNLWHHQFEASPLVALLHAIRQQFHWSKKIFDELGKITDGVVYGGLSLLGELAKNYVPKIDSVEKRMQKYEDEHFQTVLTSERFRQFFEKAVEQITGNGKLIVFIDDLDRCEGDKAFALLEAMKLYLNAKNCIFVLGMDRHQLETSLAKVRSGSMTGSDRAQAREYLSKMFQGLFLLPTPQSLDAYLSETIDYKRNSELRTRLAAFGLACPPQAAPLALLTTLTANLPPNPRKIKAFVSTWQLYLKIIQDRHPTGTLLDWRLALVLHYLGQFEEPLYRRVESNPLFFEEIIRFCTDENFDTLKYPEFEGLEVPYKHFTPAEKPPEVSGSESLEPEPIRAPSATEETKPVTPNKPAPVGFPRTLFCAPLIKALAEDATMDLGAVSVGNHVPRTVSI